jgi:hypothetical protein
MSFQLKRIAGGMGVQANSRRVGEPTTARTVENAIIQLGRSAGLLGDLDTPQDAQEVYDLLDGLIGDPPTQIVSGIECA